MIIESCGEMLASKNFRGQDIMEVENISKYRDKFQLVSKFPRPHVVYLTVKKLHNIYHLFYLLFKQIFTITLYHKSNLKNLPLPKKYMVKVHQSPPPTCATGRICLVSHNRVLQGGTLIDHVIDHFIFILSFYIIKELLAVCSQVSNNF